MESPLDSGNSLSKNLNSTPKRDNLAFGFPIFLLSESIIFVSFFVTYALLRWKNSTWFPPGVSGLDIPRAAINTVILVSSSIVLYFAERAIARHKLVKFRRLWLLTAALGVIFLIGQVIEWRDMPFGLDAGLAGATFYLLTGFHGMHVFTGVVLLLYMYGRSLVPGNYNAGHQGVSAVSLFWHFVDVIWIILFMLLYIW
ncbi:MAG: cytochrome c oxidase subunit 3 [Brasilonema octagenarum HA4186-MV1]|jgi:cytochrome c oxidase subunit 3|uniref:Heme-copper oxidase subunit III n=1 Tax=Brasilonema octagenarum UFV-OR1 TaxID=417115 RepID=A0ABX1MA47_9CYAN|nr:heme-copper oxidase subunit III [Brasilonema octagenarum]MBW4625952.1 cytochrome c oxidase subunit 3 [Brasilonema octagenarum HA4186-MV1]NMF64288.1 heme-copper oxidase subunit III [Brasilonema octagenarum UFV-OR1]